MSFASETRARSAPVLPLSAMVDVLFLLLTFFMTASVFREQELQIGVDLPAAETAQGGQGGATQITITVTGEDRIYLGEREHTLDSLRQTLADLATQFPDEAVVIRGDKGSSFGLAVQIMDVAQRAGLRDISVATVKSVEDIR